MRITAFSGQIDLIIFRDVVFSAHQYDRNMFVQYEIRVYVLQVKQQHVLQLLPLSNRYIVCGIIKSGPSITLRL